nr:PilC/PilY family type IV pilus protein [uncultured Cupriavidus sp.]
MNLANCFFIRLCALMLWTVVVCLMFMHSAFAAPGQLPLGYRISDGGYSWTGRLHALAFKTASLSSSAVLTQWEASELLDQRDMHTRRLYLGGRRIDPLRWGALDDAAKATLDSVEPVGHGSERLAWLRGERRNAMLRPRDTRLASATGARVHLVLPPRWLPMQAGHTDFRQRHTTRATTVWLGTRDGFLHGFDAITGHEIAAYLPRAMLTAAAWHTASGSVVPPPPCPRPESLDADPSQTWRTLMLCGVPSFEAASGVQPAAIFVLDISTPDAPTPIGLVWEVSATDALRLTGRGPIRAAMWIEHAARRWAAVAIIAPDPETRTRAALALLPLDRSPESWATTGDVARIGLPESGCGTPTSSTRLLATTVHSAANGSARAAYATDNQGRLWRFGLDHLSDNSQTSSQASAATCMHRQQGVAGRKVEAPIVVHTDAAPLVVYGSDQQLSAIPDSRGSHGAPARIAPQYERDGVVLRRQTGASATSGWTLSFPFAGERIDTLYRASPVHLGFTTVSPDGQQRSYLIDAKSGESVLTTGADGNPTLAITGSPFKGSGTDPIVVTSTVATDAPTAPATSTRDTFDVGLWHVDGDTAQLMQQARWFRRRGRLGWRELIRTPA